MPLGAGRAETGSGRTAHVIRRAPPPAPPGDDARPLRPRVRRPRAHPPHVKPGPASYTIEIALFLDEAAYKIFYPFLNYSEADLRDMLLAYINGVSKSRTLSSSHQIYFLLCIVTSDNLKNAVLCIFFCFSLYLTTRTVYCCRCKLCTSTRRSAHTSNCRWFA